nr:TetR/AcrR family transcriptional regulator [Dactylosporangium thailandense]
MTEAPPGRRERKKAATRQSIADAALRLFLERGYDQVSIRDIADAADVSTTTLFKHFPSKEALVFDMDEDREARLVAAVRDRPAGTDVIEALRGYARDHWLPLADDPRLAAFTALVDATPALRDYAERMWSRHTDSLAAAIADACGAPAGDVASAALARFMLQIPAITRGRPDPEAAVEVVFGILADGWRPA